MYLTLCLSLDSPGRREGRRRAAAHRRRPEATGRPHRRSASCERRPDRPGRVPDRISRHARPVARLPADKRVVDCQKKDVAAHRALRRRTCKRDRQAAALAEEALGAARGHLEIARRAGRRRSNPTERDAHERPRVHALAERVMPLVDTHAHLDQEEFDADRDAVIARAMAAGVEAIVAVGVTAASSGAVVELGRPLIRASSPPSASSPTTRPRPSRAIGSAIVELGRLSPRSWPSARRASTATGTTRRFDVQQDYFDRHLRLSQAARPAVHRAHARERRRRAGHAPRSPRARAAAPA